MICNMELFTFKPIYQKRIWGGQKLREHFQRPIPYGETIGECWELIDRPDICSEVLGGHADILTVNDLWKGYRQAVFGLDAPETPHFPLQIKLLDATERQSLQVHPPEAIARDLKAETQNKAWYFLNAQPESFVYSGLKKGSSRTDFEKAFSANQSTPQVESFIHQIKPRPDDVLFIPAGRVHGLGSGYLIFEVRQNSESTYRLTDWGRKDAQDKTRELHPTQALASIRYNDCEPFLTQPHGERLIGCPYFTFRRAQLFPDEVRTWHTDQKSFQYHFVSKGSATILNKELVAGASALVSASAKSYDIIPGTEGVEILTVLWGKA